VRTSNTSLLSVCVEKTYFKETDEFNKITKLREFGETG
jgi:hypothetical protein